MAVVTNPATSGFVSIIGVLASAGSLRMRGDAVAKIPVVDHPAATHRPVGSHATDKSRSASAAVERIDQVDPALVDRAMASIPTATHRPTSVQATSRSGPDAAGDTVAQVSPPSAVRTMTACDIWVTPTAMQVVTELHEIDERTVEDRPTVLPVHVAPASRVNQIAGLRPWMPTNAHVELVTQTIPSALERPAGIASDTQACPPLSDEMSTGPRVDVPLARQVVAEPHDTVARSSMPVGIDAVAQDCPPSLEVMATACVQSPPTPTQRSATGHIKSPRWLGGVGRTDEVQSASRPSCPRITVFPIVTQPVRSAHDTSVGAVPAARATIDHDAPASVVTAVPSVAAMTQPIDDGQLTSLIDPT